MELERRDDDRWHLVITRCGCGGTAHENIERDPDTVFSREDDSVYPSTSAVDAAAWCDTCRDIVADRYAQARDAIEHWKVTTTYRDIEWSDYDGGIDCCGWCQSDIDTLVHDPRTDALVCEVCAALYNSSATDPCDSVSITDYVQLADEVEPIVVIDNETNQRSAARIDRRPYISLDPKRKYVTVTITLTHTEYQFTEEAIAHIRDVFEIYEGRAFQQSDNKGGVEFEVSPEPGRRERRPRQRIVVDGLFEAEAREFIEDALPYIRDTTNWTYDPSDISTQSTQRAIRERGRPGPAPVPREGAPAVTVQDDGLSRHTSLTDRYATDRRVRQSHRPRTQLCDW